MQIVLWFSILGPTNIIWYTWGGRQCLNRIHHPEISNIAHFLNIFTDTGCGPRERKGQERKEGEEKRQEERQKEEEEEERKEKWEERKEREKGKRSHP